jgi:hypothetical protein
MLASVPVLLAEYPSVIKLPLLLTFNVTPVVADSLKSSV